MEIFLLILFAGIFFVIGFILGILIAAYSLSRQLQEAENQAAVLFANLYAKQHENPPPLTGDEWKNKKKLAQDDEDWLRNQLGDNDNPKGKK